MRQHIEMKQLEELSGKQLKALSKWWSQGIHEPLRGTTASLLTLGQMIELLDEYDRMVEISRYDNGWVVNETKKTHLVDALWSEVKKLLNEICLKKNPNKPL